MTFFCKIYSLMSPTFIKTFSFLCIIKTVSAKQCRYFFDNGEVKYFSCNLYEFCCGTTCCRSTAMTFYQMWYFWLMVFLTILFCSGGSWWYRIRNHDYTHSRGPQVLPSRCTVYTGQVPVQPYPTMIPNTVPMQNTAQYQYPPPPPYYGPPPSYDAVVNQAQAPAAMRQG